MNVGQRIRRLRAALVVFLVAGIAACSMADFAYDLAPRLAVRWVDDYLQLTNSQAEKALELFRERHAEHARDELPRYYRLLVETEAAVRSGGGFTQAEVDALLDEVEALYLLGVERTIPAAAKILAELDEDQLDALAERLREDVEEYRERLAEDHEERRRKEAFEDIEEWIGELDPAQRRLIVSRLEAAEETRPLWLNWRITRNERLVELLRERPAQQQLEKFLVEHWVRRDTMSEALRNGMQANRARYRDLVVELGETLSDEQRRNAHEKLAEYRDSVIEMMPEEIRLAVLDNNGEPGQRAR